MNNLWKSSSLQYTEVQQAWSEEVKMKEVLPSAPEGRQANPVPGQWDGCTVLSNWRDKAGRAGRRVVVPCKGSVQKKKL